MPDTAYFAQLAAYNRWANERLYDAADALSDEQRRRDTGLYFKSLNDTLAHVAKTDHAWLSLLRNETVQPPGPEATASFAALRSTRTQLDDKLSKMVEGLSPDDLDDIIAYTPWAGDFAGLLYSQRRRDVLTHVFNHQTHHRGQAHTGLTLLCVDAPPLDLFVMQITAGPLGRAAVQVQPRSDGGDTRGSAAPPISAG